MAAYISTQNGNWSDSATWGGSGPPGNGDTASLGNTVTVDASAIVGTSPNDDTTNVVTITSSGALIIAANVTLTVQGNIALNNSGPGLTLNAGAQLVFDANASGGTPVYKFTGINIYALTGAGSNGNPCGISAVSGQTWSISSAWVTLALNYCNLTRMAVSTINANFTDIVLASCAFDNCGVLILQATSITRGCTITDSVWSNTTGGAGSLNLQYSGAGSAARLMARNVLDKELTYVSTGFDFESNYFAGGVNCVSSASVNWESFRLNLVRHNGGLNAGNGARLNSSCERSYFIVEAAGGNPHFIAPEAKGALDTIFSQCVFEAHNPDLLDSGDILIVQAGGIAAGRKVVGQNNLAIPNSYAGANVMSGSLLTLYAADANAATEFYRNTCNVDKSSHFGPLGVLDVAEAGAGFAGQVAAFKSNLGWCSVPSNGYMSTRLTGTVQDIITAANADYNHRFNLLTGDNQRAYEDLAGSGALWAAGDAVAAGVDASGGIADPQFYDDEANVESWAAARGFGATYENGLTAVAADPTRIADLVQFVFEGFRPGNATLRNAAADGACVGAANFFKASRQFTQTEIFQNSLAVFGL